MLHGSLFSGGGGFDLAADWMKWDNLFNCERKPFAQKILKYYWPNAKSYRDIDQADFSVWRGFIDVLSGGFPCQPYSVTGKQKGKEDERHKWPQFLRAIKEIQPSWVVGENVRGIINWSRGMVFDEVQTDLEAAGYEVLPFLLPASGVNADHERYRVWFIAHSMRERPERKHVQECNKSGQMEKSIKTLAANKVRTKHENSLPQPWVISNNDGLSRKLDGITFSEWRRESTKIYGNAIDPHVAFQVFKAIELYETAPRIER